MQSSSRLARTSRRNMNTEREQRLEALLRLVQEQNFRTQDDLVKALRALDYQVTQSSISRDIRDLGLLKRGGLYTVPPKVLAGPAGTEVWRFARSVILAGDHMLVVKCQTAMAQPIAAAIDSARWSSVAGTIAGDDTVFIAVRLEASSLDLARRLRILADLD